MNRKLLQLIYVLLCSAILRNSTILHGETNPLVFSSLSSDSCHIEHRHWYTKINCVGWCLGIANASFEFEVAKHISVALPMYYSGWNFPSSTTKLRILAYQPQLRYWPDHEGGFFTDLHGSIAWWNLAVGSYRRQDHNGHRPAYGVGAAVGWRTKSKGKLKFEFSLGAGFYHLYYDRFFNSDNGVLIDTKKRNKLLIDNVSFSLAYTFRMRDKHR